MATGISLDFRDIGYEVTRTMKRLGDRLKKEPKDNIGGAVVDRYSSSIATFKKANNKQKRQTNAGNPTAKQNRVPYEPRQGAGPDFGLSTREGGPSSWTTSSQWDSDRDCRAEGIVPSFPFPPGPPGRPLHGESAYCPSQQCLRA